MSLLGEERIKGSHAMMKRHDEAGDTG